MYSARLICSDEGCAEQLLAEARTLRELETLVCECGCECECGCGLEVIGWPDHAADAEQPLAEVVAIALAGPRARAALAA
jgi:hypothetical protein